MIEIGLQREPTYSCEDRMPGDGTGCGALMRGPLGQHGSRCPSCDTGTLRNITRITRRRLERAETAGAGGTSAAKDSTWERVAPKTGVGPGSAAESLGGVLR